MTDTTSKNLILWFFICLFLVSVFLLGWLLKPFFSIIVLAGVVTGVFSPLYNKLNKQGVINAPMASLLTCMVIFLVLFVPIALFIGILSKEAFDLYQTAKDAVFSNQIQALLQGNEWIERVNIFLARFNYELTLEDFNNILTQTAKTVGFFLYEQARAVASNMLLFIVNFILMLMVIYFLLIDGDKLIRFIIALSPLPEKENLALSQKFKDIAGAVLIVNGLCGFIEGTIGGIVFALLGFKSPFLWGVIMGILAFLPIVGIGAIMLPAAFILMLKMKIAAGIFLIIFYLLLSFGAEYILKPKLVGKRVEMNMLLVFLAIIGGLQVFGILGIIYGPLVVTAFLTLTEIYHANYKKFVSETE
ncbi:MAG: AI-2E family transporter [Proteobacteria bacterium]|nr:AI-2E family transporter [Pseudomonadota bacterium]MBU4469653.1 AI-2E family transporter [Pseudomonadota bacterium]MCG2751736.1 AI-2E family transporter [Desulfobacteraceae bacterium]